ncbi:DUF7459 domain-containing protein [Mycolicibacterium litorale]|uniref:DUF7459 domain-containing protein n=1 Tax=Mycolicibacterium litorale TaxID=758802 RepID=UPI003CEBD969
MTTECEHRQVSNATRQCTECGEEMISWHKSEQRIVAGSAPNAPSFLAGFEVIYECARCSSDEPRGCGRTHRGEYLNAAGKSRRD